MKEPYLMCGAVTITGIGCRADAANDVLREYSRLRSCDAIPTAMHDRTDAHPLIAWRTQCQNRMWQPQSVGGGNSASGIASKSRAKAEASCVRAWLRSPPKGDAQHA